MKTTWVSVRVVVSLQHRGYGLNIWQEDTTLLFVTQGHFPFSLYLAGLHEGQLWSPEGHKLHRMLNLA